MKQNASQSRRRARQSGSAIVAVIGILAITSMLVGAALLEARNRFRTSHHSGRWTQAAHAAEAGAEMALMTAQDDSWTADGWTAPGAPGTVAVTKAFTLSAGVPATGPIRANVSANKVMLGGKQWLRIRSTGQADLSGSAVAGVDAQDVLLRKLSLRRDRTTGATVATPNASRTVEILAEPLSPFQRAILLDGKFNMSGGGLIDSFDSGDTNKSTGGLYDVAKRQSNADVGVNDTQNASDLNTSYVYGDVAYSGPPIVDTENVQGTVSTPFSDPVAPVLVPKWTTFNATPAAINTTMTLTGGTKASPTRYKVSSVNIAGNMVVNMAPHATGAESYIEIWVTGNFTSSGQSVITQQPGVHVTYYVEGNIAATGGTFVNQTNLAANNVINVVTPPTGTLRTVYFAGGGQFIGAINAPGSDFDLAGNANYYGALIGKTMTIRGGGSLHFDEALGRVDGEGGGYRVRSWVEAVR